MFDLSEDSVFPYEKVSDTKFRFDECNGIRFIVDIINSNYQGFAFAEPIFYPKEFSSYEPRKKFGYLYSHNRALQRKCPLKIFNTTIQILVDYVASNELDVLCIYGHPAVKLTQSIKLKTPSELIDSQRSRIYKVALGKNLSRVQSIHYVGTPQFKSIFAYVLSQEAIPVAEKFIQGKTKEELRSLVDTFN